MVDPPKLVGSEIVGEEFDSGCDLVSDEIQLVVKIDCIWLFKHSGNQLVLIDFVEHHAFVTFVLRRERKYVLDKYVMYLQFFQQIRQTKYFWRLICYCNILDGS